jgi:hypothetical protein
VERAALLAARGGASDLYVHVADDNAPAEELYLSCGFGEEAREQEAVARLLNRPRRILLHRRLPAEQ